MNKVLFVDDEALILNSLKRGLMEEEYTKFFATSGEEALRIMATEEISVLITDMKMPVMTGLELLKQVKELYPEMVKIVLSGYTHLPQVLVTVNQGDIFKFITKPWDLENEFKFVIREAVDYYNYRKELQRARFALEKKNVTFQNILKTYDDKIIAIKDELQLMRGLNELIFKENNHLLKHYDVKNDRKENVIEKLNLLQGLMIDVFELVPFVNKRFATKNIPDEFKKYVVETHSLKRVEIGLDQKGETALKGKYDLLMFVMKKMFDIFFEESYDTLINVIISSTTEKENETHLRIIMQADIKRFYKTDLQKSAFIWLQELLSRIGAELVEREIGDSNTLVLNMIFSR